MKYDKIVEISRSKSKEKARIAEKEIQQMLEQGERVTVNALAKRTGLSKGFFYQNLNIREEIEKAVKKQSIICLSKHTLADIDMQEEILELKLSLKILKLEVQRLEQQNKKLLEENNYLRKCD